MGSINERLRLINQILDGKIEISHNSNIKYPIVFNNNNLSLSPLIANNTLDDIFIYLSENNQILPLNNKKGTFGFPFLACSNDCLSNNNYYFSIKIIYFDKTKNEFKKENIDNNLVFKYLSKYLSLSPKEKEKYLLKNKKINISPPYTDNDLMLYFQLNPNISSNIEINVIFKLKELVTNRRTPHINLPIISFRSYLSKLFKNHSVNQNPYFNIAHYDLCNVLLSEWCEYGDLKNFINNFSSSLDNNYIFWSVLFFQIIYTLSTINYYFPGFKHNDLHLKNFLVAKYNRKGNLLYKIKFKNHKRYTFFMIPNLGFQIRLWDFDWASIKDENYNPKLKTFSNNSNNFNDMFYSFYEIYCTNISKSSIKSKFDKFFELLFTNYPSFNYLKDQNLFCNNIKEKHRWSLSNLKEYVTPQEILRLNSLNNQIFEEFKINHSDIKKNNFIEEYTCN